MLHWAELTVRTTKDIQARCMGDEGIGSGFVFETLKTMIALQNQSENTFSN
jgi:hypothetical protein